MRSFCLALIVVATACTEGPPTAPVRDSALPPAFDLASAAGFTGRPLLMLTGVQRQQFEAGRVVFSTQFTPATGLGPLFNAVSCASCHEVPVVGGGGQNDPEESGEDIEIHATAFHGGGRCDDLAAIGGQVFQKQVTPALGAALHIVSEAIPAAATDSGHRTTPDVFGVGLLDAVPAREILARADPLDRDGDGISGRPNRTADVRIGRFGRKAQPATLREFNQHAFVMEMGITNPGNTSEQTVGGVPLPAGVDPLPEPEITQEQFDAADAFVPFLAPPPRQRLRANGAARAPPFPQDGGAA